MFVQRVPLKRKPWKTLVSEKAQENNKRKQLHIIPLCLRYYIPTGGAVNALTDFPKATEIHIILPFF